MKATILFLSLIVFIYSLTCGGNCPTNTCHQCWCGSVINQVNTTQLCLKYDWNQACCQCIINRQSRSNANAMVLQYQDQNVKTGLWQLQEIVRVITCKIKTKQELCSPTVNIDCAFKLYEENQKRFDRPWQSSAKACGCSKPQISSQ